MTCEKMNTKVRLVRCPKCQLVLPELPEISLYKCGGCNTVLQAKQRKPDMKGADQNHESDENGKKEPDGVSNFTLSNENSAISTLDESPSSPGTSKNNEDNISDENMNTNQSQDEHSSLSPVRIEHENDNTVSIPDSGQFENEFPTSAELTSNEMEDSSIELQNILGTENDTDDQYTEADETKREKTKRYYFESSNFSDDVCSVMLDSSPESRKKDGILDSNESPQDFEHEDSSDHHLPVVESTTSELRGKDPDFTKSPTRSYYACDQVPNRSSKPPRRKLKPSNGPLKRAESGIPSLLSSETEMRYCGYNNKSGLDDDGLMSSESEIQHLSRKATFLEANSMTKVPSNRYERSDSGFLRPDTELLYNNIPDKIKLLKTINELKDELNRTRISNPSFPSHGENQHTWPCHHHHHNHQPAPRFSRTAYSGEATGRANCTCFLPQACYCSGGVPLNGMCNYKTHHQFLQEHETKSQNVRQFPTQKDHSSKRYIIPEAGGIPILSCYHCSELLQFPADFLLSSRKCHKLKCNTCQKIMKFSLDNRRHLVPYIPEHAVAPPPSMVDDFSQTSLPNSNIHSTVKPRISIDRSSSIKSERIARAPHEALKHGNMNKRNLTFGAFEPFNDDHHHTRRNSSIETVGSSGTRNDLKEVPSTSRGAYRALHRLMGYASPSQVIRR